MKLNFRQVEAFRAVMLTGAMTAAAETLGITQPAVSRLIRDLELALGITLFQRRGNLITPTAEALDFLVEVERSFLGLDHLAWHAANLRNRRSGVLRIAALPAVAIHFLPRFVAAFCHTRPGIEMQIDGIPSHLVVERAASGRIDFGVCTSSAERPSIEYFRIQASAVVVLPHDHRLACRKAIAPADLAGEPVIMLSSNSYLRHKVEDALGQVEYRRPISASLSTIACTLVLSGAGITIVDPFSASEFASRGIIIRPFTPEIDVGYCLVRPRHRPLSRLALQFMTEFRAYTNLYLHNALKTGDYP